MAYGMYFDLKDFPVSVYDEAIEQLTAAGAGWGEVPGRTFHCAMATDDGQIKVFDVWESMEDVREVRRDAHAHPRRPRRRSGPADGDGRPQPPTRLARWTPGPSGSWRRATPSVVQPRRRAGRLALRAGRRSRSTAASPRGSRRSPRRSSRPSPTSRSTMDDLVVGDEVVEYRWTFTGTSSETGKWVRIAGSEEWTIGSDGLIETSKGTYDEAEYERQLREGRRASASRRARSGRGRSSRCRRSPSPPRR